MEEIVLKKVTLLLLALSVLISIQNTEAGRRRSPKSGKIKNGVFVDSKYNFQLTIIDGWRGKPQKNNNSCRIKVEYEKNKKGDVRTDIVGVDGFELSIPLVSVWVIKTEIKAEKYLKDYLKDPISSKINNKITESMQAGWTDMRFDRFKTWTYSKITIDDHEGANWVGLLNCRYKSSDAELLYQLYSIFDCIQYDDETVLFITGRTESEDFNKVSSQMQFIMRSVKSIQEKR